MQLKTIYDSLKHRQIPKFFKEQPRKRQIIAVFASFKGFFHVKPSKTTYICQTLLKYGKIIYYSFSSRPNTYISSKIY